MSDSEQGRDRTNSWSSLPNTMDSQPVRALAEVQAAADLGQREVRLLLLLVLALTFVAYGGALSYEFVYDDHLLIVDNPFVHSWRFATRYFTRGLWEYENPNLPGNYYRPLYFLWRRINHMLFGLNPAGWHATTLGAHVLVTLLVYLLTVRLCRDRLTAIYAAMIFGLHPVHIECVAWVSGVTESLEAILFLAALLCYLRKDDPPRRARIWSAASVVFYSLALLAKEYALVLPGILFAYEWLFKVPELASAGKRAHWLRHVLRALIPYFIITALYLPVRVAVLKGFSHPMTELPLSTVILTLPSVLCFYIRLLVWPFGLSAFYDTPYVTRFDFFAVALPAAGVGLVLWGLAWWARRSRVAAFAALWLVLSLFPVLDLRVFLESEIAHDRYLYLSSVGFSILCALALRGVEIGARKAFHQPAAQVAVALGMVTLLGVATTDQKIYWADDLLLYSHGLKVAPDNPLVKINLASLAIRRGMFGAAMNLYQQVLERKPDFWLANYNLGYLYYKLGRLDEAERYITKAVENYPFSARAFMGLGFIKAQRGRLEEAAGDIRHAIALAPEGSNGHYELGLVLKAQGDLAGAVREFKAELANNPEQSAARLQIAEIEARLNPAPGGKSQGRSSDH